MFSIDYYKTIVILDTSRALNSNRKEKLKKIMDEFDFNSQKNKIILSKQDDYIKIENKKIEIKLHAVEEIPIILDKILSILECNKNADTYLIDNIVVLKPFKCKNRDYNIENELHIIEKIISSKFSFEMLPISLRFLTVHMSQILRVELLYTTKGIEIKIGAISDKVTDISEKFNIASSFLRDSLSKEMNSILCGDEKDAEC